MAAMVQDNLRHRILREVAARGLTSYMNRTKWLELQAAVRSELPFRPPYQRKDLFHDKPEPATFEEDVWYVGDWSEGILPFETIEWIRIRPRYVARLTPASALTVHDCAAQLRELLRHHSIAHEERGDSVWIHGYR